MHLCKWCLLLRAALLTMLPLLLGTLLLLLLLSPLPAPLLLPQFGVKSVALLAVSTQTITALTPLVELGRELDHFAPPAAFCQHVHVDEGLLAALGGCVLARLAGAFQPISIAPFAAEAFYCLGLPTLPALLLLRRLTSPAVVEGTPAIRTARQAAAFAATPVAGMLGKPSGRQQLVALLADLRLLCGWMLCVAQPAQHACTTEAFSGIVFSYLGQGRTPGFLGSASATRGAHQDIIHWDT